MLLLRLPAMISPDQFREFVVPSLREQSSKLDHVLYHLDGKDAIKHVDRIVKKYGSHSLFIHFPEMSLKQAEYLLDYADKNWSDVKGSFCESLEK